MENEIAIEKLTIDNKTKQQIRNIVKTSKPQAQAQTYILISEHEYNEALKGLEIYNSYKKIVGDNI